MNELLELLFCLAVFMGVCNILPYIIFAIVGFYIKQETFSQAIKRKSSSENFNIVRCFGILSIIFFAIFNLIAAWTL